MTVPTTPFPTDTIPQKTDPPQFSNVGANVVRGSEPICVARSPNMARRIAAALNWYKPSDRGR